MIEIVKDIDDTNLFELYSKDDIDFLIIRGIKNNIYLFKIMRK